MLFYSELRGREYPTTVLSVRQLWPSTYADSARKSGALPFRTQYTLTANHEPAGSFHDCSIRHSQFGPTGLHTVTDTFRSGTIPGNLQQGFDELLQLESPLRGDELSSISSGLVPERHYLRLVARLRDSIIAVMALADGGWHLLRL